MPLPKGARVRQFKSKTGVPMRIAFAKGTNEAVEVKSLRTGAVHSKKEFSADRARRLKARRSR